MGVVEDRKAGWSIGKGHGRLQAGTPGGCCCNPGKERRELKLRPLRGKRENRRREMGL